MAKDPAASGVSLRRRAAPPPGSRRRPGARSRSSPLPSTIRCSTMGGRNGAGGITAAGDAPPGVAARVATWPVRRYLIPRLLSHEPDRLTPDAVTLLQIEQQLRRLGHGRAPLS